MGQFYRLLQRDPTRQEDRRGSGEGYQLCGGKACDTYQTGVGYDDLKLSTDSQILLHVCNIYCENVSPQNVSPQNGTS